MYYIVYKITLLRGNLAGKFYIGQHVTQNLEDNYAGSGTIVKRYYSKYGKILGDSYNKEILEYCANSEELNAAEERWVGNAYDTNEKCLNLKAGGLGKTMSKKWREEQKGRPGTTTGRVRIHKEHLNKTVPLQDLEEYLKSGWIRGMSEDSVEKNKQHNLGKVAWNRGKKMSDEFCKKVSESKKGKPNYKNRGRVWSEEMKKHFSDIKKGRRKPEGFGEKIAKILRGKPKSEEARQHNSEAQKSYWKNNPKIWINNGKEAIRVSEKDFKGYGESGYVRGRGKIKK